MKYLLYSKSIGIWREFDNEIDAQKELDYSNIVSNRMDGCNTGDKIVYKTEDGIFIDKECTKKLEILEKTAFEKMADQYSEQEKLWEFVRLVATPARNDGTFNYCREALQQKAVELLKAKQC